MKLSKNFTLEEFLISQTAARNDIDMTPSKKVQGHIVRLVETILQPIRDNTGSIFISSGFRPDELNKLIGGSETSAHRFGCAADLRATGLTPLETCQLIVDLDLPYDQVIHEFGRWVHVGIRWDGMLPRKEQLTAYKQHGKTAYIHGLHAVGDLI